jgi:uroporphyrinogen decarboxylase
MASFSPLKNDTFIRALLRQPTDYTPLWLMRQAGRYLPEYRATRARAGSFLGLAKNPDYATEVTLQPLARYPLDAAILFSDILTVPDAMGLGLYFADGEGPKFERPLRDEQAVMALRAPELESLQYVFDAVTQIRTELFGQPVDAGLLYGRRRRFGRPSHRQEHAVQPAGPDASHPENQRRRGRCLSECASRRRRPGADDI